MALSDLSFKLYTNSSLTTLYGGTTSLLHKTDLSDNPQDFVIYFGSMGSNGAGATDRELVAVSNPGVDDIIITPTDTLPEFQASHAYTLGQSVEPTVGNGLRYEVSTAGTSSTEPTWPTSGVGSLVTSGTAVFKLVGASHQISEVKLASTEAGLASATGGAELSLGTAITSGVANAKPIWVRVTNTVNIPSNNSGTPEIGLYINEVREETV